MRRLDGKSALALFVLVLAGCGGGGAGVGTPSSAAQAPRSTLAAGAVRAASAGSGNVTFTVGVPQKPKAAAARRTPKYISPSTQSLKIVTDGSAAVIVNLTPSSANCTLNEVLDVEVCTASLNVPAGNHVFTVTTYDAVAAGGNILSTNTTGTVVVKSSGTTTVPLVLEGLVSRVALSFPNAPTLGTPATLGLTAVLSDADGNIIIGPAAYDNPVTLTTTDSVNGPLSTTLLSSPADASAVTVKYSGADVASITYSATATGLASANVTNAVLTPGSTATYTSLYAFAGGTNDGALPQAGLTVLSGQLFGTTSQGGIGTCTYFVSGSGCGVVFKVSPAGPESVVHRFAGGVTDGGNPNAPLLDVGGTLYGTTQLYGVTSAGCCGVAFSVNPGGAEHVLYRFQGGPADGAQGSPGGLVHVNGVLYGTTVYGGGSSAGLVYALTFSGTETILHSFTGLSGDSGPGLDGAYPGGGLLNVGGVLYGTTAYGGGNNSREEEGCGGDGCGTIFTIGTSGAYRQVYRSTNYFGGSDAEAYNGNLVAVNGAFFGTSGGGGAASRGTVFVVSAAGTERVLYSFAGGSDGSGPQPGLVNLNGTLYGTTVAGGNSRCANSGCGTIFAITPSGTERVLYRFLGGSDGSNPNGPLVLLNGMLYGTTNTGGKHNLGTVFALKL